MQEDTQNKNQKSEESSLMQNDELTIGPSGGVPNKETEPEPTQKVEKEGPKVVERKVKKKKKDVFNMRLEDLKKKAQKKPAKKVIKEEKKPLQLFAFKGLEKESFAFALVKTAGVFLLSLAIFVGTLYFDQFVLIPQDVRASDIAFLQVPQAQSVSVVLHGAQSTITDVHELSEGEQINTGTATSSIITFGDSAAIRLDSNTDITLVTSDPNAKKYHFKLLNGSVWGNTLASKIDMQIDTEYASIIPGNSAFSISYDGTKTDLYSDVHDIFVTLKVDGEEINKFWIAEGNQAQLLNSKLTQKTSTIKKLLLSKLIKEFNYGRISTKKVKEDQWISNQKNLDSAYRDALVSKLNASLRNQGLKTLSVGSIRSQFKSLLHDLRNSLTFSEKKKNELMLDAIFENINDANYLFLQQNDIDANVRLSLFKEDIVNPSYASNENFQQELNSRLLTELEKLLFVQPGEVIYPVKQTLLEEILNRNEQFGLLTLLLNDVYDALDTKPADSVSLFTYYFEIFDKLIRSYRDNLGEIQDEIIKQNILVDNLLFQTPELYKLDFFEAKKDMEDKYILSLTNIDDKKEQRQTFISNKIDLLSRIRFFLFNESIGPEDARQIVFRLMQDIEEYQEGTLSAAAVNELFEKRLQDFVLFWEYLRSDEYSTTPLHGDTHAERFEEFKKVQEEIITFQEIREEILGGGGAAELTVENILDQTEEDLKNADIQEVKFGAYNDSEQAKIPILSAKVGGIVFRAQYDWDRKLLSNIIVDNNVISLEGVKVDKAKKFIFEAVASLTRVDTKDDLDDVMEEDEPMADIKRAAKVFLVEKFSQMDMTIKTDAIEITDFNNGEYSVKNVFFSENKLAKFSFDYTTRDDKVSNLIIKTDEGDKTVDDTFSSTFLKQVVLKIYDEALEK